MPTAALKSLAKKAGVPMSTAEHDWDHAKKIVKKNMVFPKMTLAIGHWLLVQQKRCWA
jgi:hypothetical protein